MIYKLAMEAELDFFIGLSPQVAVFSFGRQVSIVLAFLVLWSSSSVFASPLSESGPLYFFSYLFEEHHKTRIIEN